MSKRKVKILESKLPLLISPYFCPKTCKDIHSYKQLNEVMNIKCLLLKQIDSSLNDNDGY